MKKFDKKTWLLPAGSPEIAEYRETFELLKTSKPLVFSVPPERVNEMQVYLGQNLICALEHYPDMIENLLFSFDFKFEKVADSEQYYQELEWKGRAKYMRWFAKLGSFPLFVFFISDPDARLYCMAGDLLADRKVKAEESDRPEKNLVFEGETLKTLMDRMWQSCLMLLVYCTSAPFDILKYLDIFIAEYNPTFSLDQVVAEYEKMMEEGFQYLVKPDNAN